MLFYLNALLIFAADQTIKFIVQHFMRLGQSIPLSDDLLKLTYVQNTGAAFSLFVGFSSYLAIIGLVVVAAVVYFYHRLPEKKPLLQTGLSLLLGGSIGNLFDRVARGYVVDYIDVAIWPVFNLADIMINLGVLFIIFNYLKTSRIAD